MKIEQVSIQIKGTKQSKARFCGGSGERGERQGWRRGLQAAFRSCSRKGGAVRRDFLATRGQGRSSPVLAECGSFPHVTTAGGEARDRGVEGGSVCLGGDAQVKNLKFLEKKRHGEIARRWQRTV